MGWGYYAYDRVELHLEDGKIKRIQNLLHLKYPNDFAPEYKKEGLAKLYLVKDDTFYKYVGATMQPIHTKLAQGLRANGQHGYHGYKWKNLDTVEVFVWTFNNMTKAQIEAVEAELVFQIRNAYGRWTDCQNEIHFNNTFTFARVLARDIFEYLEYKYPLQTNLGFNEITSELFEEPFQYGLRGDPYLWKDLKARFEYSEVQNLAEFKALLRNGFKENTGSDPVAGKHFRISYFDFGGMSSGVVSANFWIEKGFPLLEERFKKLNN
jgi:hypothetical protein